MLSTFRNLSQREQLLLAGLAGLLALLILVFGVIGPVMSFADRSVDNYARAERIAAMSRGLEAVDAESPEARALRSVVTELADRRKVVYTRINNTTDGQLQLDLENTPYAAFFGWLQDLEREEDIVVSEAFVTPGEANQSIEARLTLTRAE